MNFSAPSTSQAITNNMRPHNESAPRTYKPSGGNK